MAAAALRLQWCEGGVGAKPPGYEALLSRSGGGRIRTSEGRANGFTARPLWPLGNTPRGGHCSQRQAQRRLAGVVPCQVTYPSAVTRATVVLKHPLPCLRGTRKTAFPPTPVAIR